MTAQVPPLIEILAEIPDVRQRQGKRHPLAGMMALGVTATVCGYETIGAIAEWGRNYGEEYQEELGFERHGYPAQVTWYRVFRDVAIEVVEQKLGEWCEQVLQAMTGEGERVGISVDGKTLRGRKKQGADKSHLLAAASHQLGMVLRQIGVDDHTNEIGVVEAVLLPLVLEGRVVTADALLTQHKVAQTIVDRGGDYVLPVKQNQENTYHTLEYWFASQPPRYLANRVVETIEKKHGRTTHWRMEVTTALNDYLVWPGLAQSFKLTRRSVKQSTGELTEEIHFGITSLSPHEATPLDLLKFTRAHWSIENRLHWVRDVTFDEDRSQLRLGHAHQLMAAFRNLAIVLLRLMSHPNIASATHFFAARPNSALLLVSQPIPLRE
jgi:predicted transposase YbfD/YdcC